MRILASILIIIAVLGAHGNTDARPLDGTAGIARNDVRRVRARGARRPRARGRHETAPPLTNEAGRHRAAPNSQPAHMAPQPEDVPPVKPRKKALPPADKRNPRQ
jgi:hypothetical protein